MAGIVAYTLHTKKELGGGHKPKYLQIGVIIKNESTGHLYGNIEMLPIPTADWDGRFYLFIPKGQQKELEKAMPAPMTEEDMDQSPF